MDLNILIKGFVLGASIAAPVGPIGILCIRRTLSGGWKVGLLTGLGAATADALYGALAGTGLVLVTQWLVGYQAVFRLVGGLFLLFLGLRIGLSHPAAQTAEAAAPRESLLGAYLSTFLLTLTNPATILSFMGVFAGAGLSSTNTQDQSAIFLLVLGVFCGSAAWWLFLSGLVGKLRSRSSERARTDGFWMVWVNRLSGLCLSAFGAATLWSLWFA